MSCRRWRVRYTYIKGEKVYELYRLRKPDKPDREWNRIYPSLYMMIRPEESQGGKIDNKSLLAVLRARDILEQSEEEYDT